MTKESVRTAANAAWNKSNKDEYTEPAFKDVFAQGVRWMLDKAVHWPWPQVMENLTTAYKNMKQ